MMVQQQLDLMFHALSDPHRRGMFEQLSRGSASVKELARPTGMALPSVLKHLKVLEAGGIVASEKVGRVRTYRVEPGALDLIESWVAERKRNWSLAFDRLEQAMNDYPENPRAETERP
jgi:DNA-binding transcriptional ArsR family regulator